MVHRSPLPGNAVEVRIFEEECVSIDARSQTSRQWLRPPGEVLVEPEWLMRLRPGSHLARHASTFGDTLRQLRLHSVQHLYVIDLWMNRTCLEVAATDRVGHVVAQAVLTLLRQHRLEMFQFTYWQHAQPFPWPCYVVATNSGRPLHRYAFVCALKLLQWEHITFWAIACAGGAPDEYERQAAWRA